MAKPLPIALAAAVLSVGCFQPVTEGLVGARSVTSAASTGAGTSASTSGGAGVAGSTGASVTTAAASTGTGTSSNGGVQGTTTVQQNSSGTTGGFGTSGGTTGGATTGGVAADICEQAQSVYQQLANCPLPEQPTFSFSACEASLSSCSPADQQAVQSFVTCASNALAGGCSTSQLLTLVASFEICQQIISGLSPGCGGGL